MKAPRVLYAVAACACAACSLLGYDFDGYVPRGDAADADLVDAAEAPNAVDAAIGADASAGDGGGTSAWDSAVGVDAYGGIDAGCLGSGPAADAQAATLFGSCWDCVDGGDNTGFPCRFGCLEYRNVGDFPSAAARARTKNNCSGGPWNKQWSDEPCPIEDTVAGRDRVFGCESVALAGACAFVAISWYYPPYKASEADAQCVNGDRIVAP